MDCIRVSGVVGSSKYGQWNSSIAMHCLNYSMFAKDIRFVTLPPNRDFGLLCDEKRVNVRADCRLFIIRYVDNCFQLDFLMVNALESIWIRLNNPPAVPSRKARSAQQISLTKWCDLCVIETDPSLSLFISGEYFSCCFSIVFNFPSAVVVFVIVDLMEF